MLKATLVVDRAKNRIFAEVSGHSAEAIQQELEDTEEGCCKPGDTFLLGEQTLELEKDLQVFLEALRVLDTTRHPDEESRVSRLLRVVFEAGVKLGVKHGEEIRARHISL